MWIRNVNGVEKRSRTVEKAVAQGREGISTLRRKKPDGV
jgi:hypothetical protein